MRSSCRAGNHGRPWFAQSRRDRARGCDLLTCTVRQSNLINLPKSEYDALSLSTGVRVRRPQQRALIQTPSNTLRLPCPGFNGGLWTRP